MSTKQIISPKIAQRMKEAEAERAHMIKEVEADFARTKRELEEADRQLARQREQDYKKKGYAYVDFVEELGDLLDVPRPDLIDRRNRKTGEIIRSKSTGEPLKTDPDEDGRVRTAQLLQVIREAIQQQPVRHASEHHQMQ